MKARALDRAVSHIVNTSVHDGLMSASSATDRVISQAIDAERLRSRPRTALITGLERELRRRAKQKGKS